MHFRPILLLPFVLLVACQKKDILPGPNTQRYNINSALEHDMVKGFDVEGLRVIPLPNTGALTPDFMVGARTNVIGDVSGAFLYAYDGKTEFSLTQTFQALDPARDFFQGYDTSTASSFEPYGFDLAPYQVWTVKTSEGTQGKLLIISTFAQKRGVIPYAEISFLAGVLN